MKVLSSLSPRQRLTSGLIILFILIWVIQTIKPSADVAPSDFSLEDEDGDYVVTLRNYQNAPLASFLAILNKIDESTGKPTGQAEAEKTDNQGRASFLFVPPGVYELSLYTPTHELLPKGDVDRLVHIVKGKTLEETLSFLNYPPNQPPTLTFLEPVTDKSLRVGQTTTIRFTLADPDDAATASLYYASGSQEGQPITSCQNSAKGTNLTCVWDLRNLVSATYTIYAVAQDSLNKPVRVEAPGKITLHDPSATFTFTSPGTTTATVAQGQSFAIGYSLKDSYSRTFVSFGYRLLGGGSARTAISECQNKAQGATAQCAWNTTTLRPGYYELVAEIYRDGTGTANQITAPNPVIVLPIAPTLSSVKDVKNKAQIKWQGKTRHTPITQPSFEIHRADSATGPFTLVSTFLGQRQQTSYTYTDTTVKKKKTYYYKVRERMNVSGPTRQETLYSDYSSVRSVKIK